MKNIFIILALVFCSLQVRGQIFLSEIQDTVGKGYVPITDYDPELATYIQKYMLLQDYLEDSISWASVPVGLHDAVTLAGSYDYITLSGQVITRNQIDLTTDVTGLLPYASLSGAPTLLSQFTDDLGHVEESTTVTDLANGLDISLSTYDITVSPDFVELTTETTIDGTDYIIMHDATTPNDGKITAANFISSLGLAEDGELHDAVTLSGAYDYITLSGQDIVRGQVDLTTDVTGVLPLTNQETIWQKTGNKIYYSDDDVGVNVSNPLERFHVNGRVLITDEGSFGGNGYVGVGEFLNLRGFAPNIRFIDESGGTDTILIHVNQNNFRIGRSDGAGGFSSDIYTTSDQYLYYPNMPTGHTTNILTRGSSGLIQYSASSNFNLSDFTNDLTLSSFTDDLAHVEESTTVSDSDNIDLTLTTYDISADVILDVDANNILTTSVSGLLVDKSGDWSGTLDGYEASALLDNTDDQTLQEVLTSGNDAGGLDALNFAEVEADEFIGDLRGAVLFKAQAGETLAKGDVVYVSGISGNTTIVSKADADDANKMPAFGVVAAAASSPNPVDIYTFGTLSNLNTSAYSLGDVLYVSTTAGQLTATPPTGESALLQNIAKVTRVDNSAGSIKISGAGRTNATPNLNTGRLFVGNASNQAVADGTVYVDIANSRVGIGTASISATLDVNGDVEIATVNTDNTTDDVLVHSSDGTVSKRTIDNLIEDAGYWDRNSGSAYTYLANGSDNVGIGEIDRGYKINIGDVDPPYIFLRNYGGSVSYGESYGGLLIFDDDESAGNTGNRIGAAIKGIAHDQYGNMRLGLFAGSTNSQTVYGEGVDYTDYTIERISILPTGNTGIGLTNPSQKLQVAGNIFTDNSGSSRTIRAYNSGGNYSELDGIGLESDAVDVFIRGTVDGGQDLYLGYNSVEYANIYLGYQGYSYWIDSQNTIAALGDYTFRMYDSSSNEDVRLNANGDSYIMNDLGIGTNNLIGNLTVAAENRVITIGDSGRTNYAMMKATNTAGTSAAYMIQDAYGILYEQNGTLAYYHKPLHGGIGLYDVTGATEDVRISATTDSWFNGGNLGIGLSSPLERFVVSGGNMQLRGSTYTDFTDYWGGNDNSAFFTPYGFLGSSGSFAVSLYSNGYRNDTAGFTYIGTNGNTSTASGIDLMPTGDIYFRNGTASGTALPIVMTIKNGGNTGIATSNPSAKLDVNGDVEIATVNTDNTTDDILVHSSDGTVSKRTIDNLIEDAGYWDRSGTTLTPATSGDNVTIDGVLKVENSAAALLTLDRTGSSGGDIYFQNDSGSIASVQSGGSGQLTISSDPSNILSSSRIEFDVDGSEAMRVTSDLRVGIGTSTPSKQLTIQSDGNAESLIETTIDTLAATTLKNADAQWRIGVEPFDDGLIFRQQDAGYTVGEALKLETDLDVRVYNNLTVDGIANVTGNITGYADITGDDFFVRQGIVAEGDTDTEIDMNLNDEIEFYAGGRKMFRIDEDAQDVIEFNPNAHDIDFLIDSDNVSEIFKVDASADEVQINGEVTWSERALGEMYRLAEQSVTNGNTDKIDFATQVYQDGDITTDVTTNDRITVTNAGKYTIHLSALMSNDGTGSDSGRLLIYKNGTQIADSEFSNVQHVGLKSVTRSISGILNLAASDYLEVYLQELSGTGDAEVARVRFTVKREIGY